MKSLRSLFLIAILALTASAAHAADLAPATSQEAFTLYQFSGSSEALKMMDEQLRKDPRFSELGCEQTNKAKRKSAPRYLCNQNDGRTYEFFMSNLKTGVQLKSSSGACPAGCTLMKCPPNIGPIACCKFPPYRICTN